MKRSKGNPYQPGPARTPDVPAELAALKAATREAHEAIKSIRVEKAETDRAITALMGLYEQAMTHARRDLQGAVDDMVKGYIESWMTSARQANTEMHELMVSRFREITRLWLRELIEGLMTLRDGRPLGFRTQIMGGEIDEALTRTATVLPHLVVTAWDGEADATLAEVVEVVTRGGAG